MKVKSITLENGEVFNNGGEYEFSDDGMHWTKGVLTSIIILESSYPFKVKLKAINKRGEEYNGNYKFIRKIVRPKPLFKVGDKVKIIKKDKSTLSNRALGLISIINKVEDCGDKYSYELENTGHDVVHEDELELYTPPEMIDLPDGITIFEPITGFSRGISFNEGNQLLNVVEDTGLYNVDSHGYFRSNGILNKTDYCLIKSTKKECVDIIGTVFISYLNNKDFDINNYKNNLDFWHISLGKNDDNGKCEVVYIKDDKSATPYEICDDWCCDGYIYYKLVKRLEV